MSSARIERSGGWRAARQRWRATAVCGLSSCLMFGCSTLFDAPSFEDLASRQAGQMLEEVVTDEATFLIEQGRERITSLANEGLNELQRVIVFPHTGNMVGVSTRSWPVMRVDKVGQGPPQLVLESPISGLVFLDDREIGLVQDDSVRIVTLEAGEHRIRIEQARMPPMAAQFYIDNGERITLRWESP